MSLLIFAKQRAKEIKFMLCKNLRSPFKNSPLDCFFHCVRIPQYCFMQNKKALSCENAFMFWRRMGDSNPRARKGKRFSRPPRYDHFDNPPCLTTNIGYKFKKSLDNCE